MDSVRKRVMRFSPLREELGLEEKMLTPLISSSSSLSLELGGSSSNKRKSKSEEASETQQEFRDIVSVTILRQLWHVADTIFKHLDAVSLLHCEKVCELWRQYLLQERVWQKAVEKFAQRFPGYIQHVGWWKHLPSHGGQRSKDVLVYRHTYWKMTNLNRNWGGSAGRTPSEQKKLFHRSGPISWRLLPSGRAVSVYGDGKGFIVKVHDNLGFKFRSSHYNSAGTVKGDKLCMDASETRVVVGGTTSQKVWVFTLEEEDPGSQGIVTDLLVKMTRPRSRTLTTKLTKFIAATGPVARLQLHSDNCRVAVLLPQTTSLEVWNLHLVTRLHRFTLNPDASFLIWRKDILVVAPLFTGVVQVFDTASSSYKEREPLIGALRKIDALAAFENLAATAESRTIRLWDLTTSASLVSWVATKTYISALYMNDTMVVSGSAAGIVKLWDLPKLLDMPDGSIIQPLRKINMKGVLHYPIKEIYQCTYTDLVIIAKYEGKKKKDKVKIVEVSWN